MLKTMYFCTTNVMSWIAELGSRSKTIFKVGIALVILKIFGIIQLGWKPVVIVLANRYVLLALLFVCEAIRMILIYGRYGRVKGREVWQKEKIL